MFLKIMILILGYILIFSQIKFVMSIQVFNMNAAETIQADNTMRTKPIAWHMNTVDNIFTPVRLDLRIRVNLCTSIFQHPNLQFVYDQAAAFENTECFQMNIPHFLPHGVALIQVILCPCPRVLGNFNNIYLVKGPENRSMLLYTNGAEGFFVNFGFVTEIQDNELYPPNVEHPSPRSPHGHTPPPRSSSTSMSSSNGNNNGAQVRRRQTPRVLQMGSKRRRLNPVRETQSSRN